MHTKRKNRMRKNRLWDKGKVQRPRGTDVPHHYTSYRPTLGTAHTFYRWTRARGCYRLTTLCGIPHRRHQQKREQNNTLLLSMARRWGNCLILSLLQFKLGPILGQHTNSIASENDELTSRKSFIWGLTCLPARWKKPIRATIEKKNGQPHPVGRREREKKEGAERAKKLRVTLVLRPHISLVSNGAIHLDTPSLSATGRLGVQSRTMEICSDHGFGVVTLQTWKWN